VLGAQTDEQLRLTALDYAKQSYAGKDVTTKMITDRAQAFIYFITPAQKEEN
jgi:hypothetical protein